MFEDLLGSATPNPLALRLESATTPGEPFDGDVSGVVGTSPDKAVVETARWMFAHVAPGRARGARRPPPRAVDGAAKVQHRDGGATLRSRRHYPTSDSRPGARGSAAAPKVVEPASYSTEAFQAAADRWFRPCGKLAPERPERARQVGGKRPAASRQRARHARSRRLPGPASSLARPAAAPGPRRPRRFRADCRRRRAVAGRGWPRPGSASPSRGGVRPHRVRLRPGSSIAYGDVPAFVDGWAVRFDHVIVTVAVCGSPPSRPGSGRSDADRRARRRTPAPTRSTSCAAATSPASPDRPRSAPRLVTTLRPPPTRAPDERYAFGFDLIPASSSATRVNLDAEGRRSTTPRSPRAGRRSTSGTATYRGAAPERARVRPAPDDGAVLARLASAASYVNCENSDLPRVGCACQRGVTVPEGEAATAQITLHTDHLFLTALHDEVGRARVRRARRERLEPGASGPALVTIDDPRRSTSPGSSPARAIRSRVGAWSRTSSRRPASWSATIPAPAAAVTPELRRLPRGGAVGRAPQRVRRLPGPAAVASGASDGRSGSPSALIARTISASHGASRRLAVR